MDMAISTCQCSLSVLHVVHAMDNVHVQEVKLNPNTEGREFEPGLNPGSNPPPTLLWFVWANKALEPLGAGFKNATLRHIGIIEQGIQGVSGLRSSDNCRNCSHARWPATAARKLSCRISLFQSLTVPNPRRKGRSRWIQLDRTCRDVQPSCTVLLPPKFSVLCTDMYALERSSRFVADAWFEHQKVPKHYRALPGRAKSALPRSCPSVSTSLS